LEQKLQGIQSSPKRVSSRPLGSSSEDFSGCHEGTIPSSIFAGEVTGTSDVAIENAKLYRKSKKAYQDLKAAQADVVQVGRIAAVG